ncbi:MAG TPA: 4-(cytidine 5'-diphospho)-2-C-methyl-D-erythritol kinase, partial [Candidatus Polarisedimenticolia bacterium]|nr:4-(cytidine 5'-diphospho)-2-C-methyl-D-erythritol kinase [Candidatus Polarisedimenticolia bacterium]
MSRLTLRAHAKINLNLKIVGRRRDGYHDLDSVLQTITLHDSLTLEDGPGGLRLEVDDPAVEAGASNLVHRAAERLLEEVRGRRRGARIILRKRIPMGAGLGGGSSDAAAALVGLNRLWNLGLDAGKLSTMAGTLGSDVPFFLVGGTARLTGRGLEVAPLPDSTGYALLLVFPGMPVSTWQVYAQLHVPLTPSPETGSMTSSGPDHGGDVRDWVRSGNDLEAAARSLCPAIGEIRDRLLAAGAGAAAMTGSGSAVFGTFPDKEAVERAAPEFVRRGWVAVSCEPL